MTDELPAYRKPGESFWQHRTINHGSAQHAPGIWHTNTAENFFSIFKRGILGIYHHISAAHLHRYCVEFDFRHNNGTVRDAERADQSLRGIYGKRLTYRRPYALAA